MSDFFEWFFLALMYTGVPCLIIFLLLEMCNQLRRYF